MKKTVTSLLLMWAIGSCSTSFLQAQTAVEKGLKSINRPSAEAIVGFLADDALQGREAGMIGSGASRASRGGRATTSSRERRVADSSRVWT
jgi:hypothetical protein